MSQGPALSSLVTQPLPCPHGLLKLNPDGGPGPDFQEDCSHCDGCCQPPWPGSRHVTPAGQDMRQCAGIDSMGGQKSGASRVCSEEWGKGWRGRRGNSH